MKSCFLFGHHDCPSNVQSEIEKVVTKHYSYYGVRYFYVGYHGLFDRIAASAIKNVKKRFTDIRLYLLLAYHPAEYPIEIPDGFDGSYYPPLQNVPRRFAIVQANRHLVDSCDTLICYVNHCGNSRKLLQYAHRQTRKRPVLIENLAEGNIKKTTMESGDNSI